MKKIRNKEKNIEIFMVYIFAFIVIYALFALFMNESFVGDHVSTDSIEKFEKWPDIRIYLSGGRVGSYITSIIGLMFYKIGVNKYQNQYILQILLIALCSLSLCVLYDIFQRFFQEKKEKIILSIILIIAFGNSFFGESFVFVGWELGVGILCAVYAVRMFTKKKYLLSAFFAFFGTSIYQSYIEIFLIYTCLYIYLDNNTNFAMKLIWQYLKVAIIALIATTANIMIPKIALYFGIISNEVKKVGGTRNFIQRIEDLIYSFFRILYISFGCYPKAFLFLVLFLIFISATIYMILKKRKSIDILYFFAFYGVMNLFYTVLFFVASEASEAPRIVWPVFSTISSLMIVCMYIFKEVKWKKIGLIILGMFWFINIYYTQTAAMDFYITNKLEYELVRSIEQEIIEYEKENGIEITTVATKKMEGASYYYKCLNLQYDTDTYSYKTLHREWSDVELLNYLTGNNYLDVKMTESEYNKYFKNVCYDVYMPSKQLVFKDNILYWLIY